MTYYVYIFAFTYNAWKCECVHVLTLVKVPFSSGTRGQTRTRMAVAKVWEYISNMIVHIPWHWKRANTELAQLFFPIWVLGEKSYICVLYVIRIVGMMDHHRWVIKAYTETNLPKHIHCGADDQSSKERNESQGVGDHRRHVLVETEVIRKVEA